MGIANFIIFKITILVFLTISSCHNHTKSKASRLNPSESASIDKLVSRIYKLKQIKQIEDEQKMHLSYITGFDSAKNLTTIKLGVDEKSRFRVIYNFYLNGKENKIYLLNPLKDSLIEITSDTFRNRYEAVY